MPLDADMWRNPNRGAAQSEDESEGQVMVVSKEHVAKQVRAVIAWREKRLAHQRLSMDTIMNNEQKERAARRAVHRCISAGVYVRLGSSWLCSDWRHRSAASDRANVC